VSRLRSWWAGFGWARRDGTRRPMDDQELATGLAGFCADGVGMLDQCDDCCPPVRPEAERR
jgi:hypothetical protein